MNPLDVRTVMLGHLLTNTVCALIVTILWVQNRRRFAGMSWWVADFAGQAIASGLIVLRGGIPDWLSIVGANALVVGGACAGLIGLERFTGRRRSHGHNLLLLAVFVAVHACFTFAQPNLTVRTLNVSLGLLIFCGQCVWLMLRRVSAGQRQMAHGVGVVFAAYSLVSLTRIVVLLGHPLSTNDFFKTGGFDILVVLAYQALFILLTFSLALMVNRRLLMEVQAQEEKFTIAFRSAPYAFILTRLPDGRILDVNDGFVSLSGYTEAEALGNNTVDLQLWARAEDRAAVVDALSHGRSVRGRAYPFRIKSGEIITGLFSAEFITINGQACALSSITDITARQHAEEERQRALEEVRAANEQLSQANEELASVQEALAAERDRYQELFDAAPDGYLVTDRLGVIQEANRAAASLLAAQPGFLAGCPLAVFVPDDNDERRRFRAQLADLARVDQVRDLEVWLQPQHGAPIPAAITATAVRSGDGALIGVRWLLRDISERKAAAARLAGQNEDLQRWKAITLGRENRVLQLKSEVNALAARLGEPPRYGSVD